MRQKTLFIRCSLLATLTVVMLAGALQAEQCITMTMHSDGYQLGGQTIPATDDTTVTWLGKGMAYLDTGDSTSILVLADKNMMYQIDHKSKEYYEIPPNFFENIIKEMGGLEGPAAQSMAAMKSMMAFSVTVTPTEETKKIKEWNCKKYSVETNMGQARTTSELWATEDITVDQGMYLRISNAMMAQLPGFEKAREEWKKIKGITVLNTGTTNVMGTSIGNSQELLKVVEKDAPAGIFGLPKDYKKVDAQLPGMR